MIGAQYKCPTCKNKSQKTTVTFMSWDSDIIKSLAKALSAEFPIVLTHYLIFGAFSSFDDPAGFAGYIPVVNRE